MNSKICESNDVLLTLYDEDGVYYLDLVEVLQYLKTERSTFLDPIRCYVTDSTLIHRERYDRVLELIRIDVALIRLCRSQKTRFALLVHWILLTFKLTLITDK